MTVKLEFNDWLRTKYAFDNVDYWLDRYNDYISLYKIFKDQEYLTKANETYNEMLQYLNKNKELEELIIN